MNKEERQVFIDLLRKQQDEGDIEAAHSNADDLLIQVLEKYGEKEIIEEWEKVPKWYA